MLWTFLSYVNGRAECEYDVWCKTASSECRARFEARVAMLGNMEYPEWSPKFCKQLKLANLVYEVRFIANNVQHRPLGFMWPQRRSFTFVKFATEHNDRFVPSDAVDIALRRIDEIKNGTRQTKEINVV